MSSPTTSAKVEAAGQEPAAGAEAPPAGGGVGAAEQQSGGDAPDKVAAKVPGLGSDSGGEGEGEDAGAAGSSSESDEGYATVLTRLKELMAGGGEEAAPPAGPPVLSSFDLAGVAELIKSGRARRIVVMCGAGISVSAGIPDFRTPGTGLYHRLEAYNLPYPQAVFEIDFFRRNPKPFFLLARALFPGRYAPTPAHHFLALLHAKGLLLRCFTQNIDSLELQAGLPRDAVIAAHGNFDSARCIRCAAEHPTEHVRAAVMAAEGNPAYCRDAACGGLVKPDIVFFGENLPERFFKCAPVDLGGADLLIVMGTSLVVHPFASLIDYVGESTPRLLINREKAGEADPALRAAGYRKGFDFRPATNTRDALFLGDCDAGVRQLCCLLGWEAELEGRVAEGLRTWAEAAAAAAAEAAGGGGSGDDASTAAFGAADGAAETSPPKL